MIIRISIQAYIPFKSEISQGKEAKQGTLNS